MESQEILPTPCLYVPVNGPSKKLTSPPPIETGVVRVVCISDTHNQQDDLNLPWGHLLVHAGDILTESGVRYVGHAIGGKQVLRSEYPKELFEKFAKWLGAQAHPHKLIIPGNHDSVLEVMGEKEITRVIGKYSRPGSTAYLLHEEARIGNIKVFGSPYHAWSSHNNGFFAENVNYNDITPNTHIVVTHMPAILPSRKGGQSEDKLIMEKLHSRSVLLHVSGHCHWAYGVFHSQKSPVVCAVASVCSSTWVNPVELLIASPTPRGDKKGDLIRGGYNVLNLPIVCDLIIPGGGPPLATDNWILKSDPDYEELDIPMDVAPEVHIDRQNLMVWGDDSVLRKRTKEELKKYYKVYNFKDNEELERHLREDKKEYLAFICFGEENDEVGKIIQTVRGYYDQKIYIIFFQSTDEQKTQKYSKLDVNLFANRDLESEKKMRVVLKKIATQRDLKSPKHKTKLN